MILRWIGALLVIAGCGGLGFSMAMHYRKQEQCLRQLIKTLDIFSCELEFRLLPLPDVCRSVSKTVGGCVGNVFAYLAAELDSQVCPDAACCMEAALHSSSDVPGCVKNLLAQLGQTLGRFDVAGQLSELAATKADCMEKLDTIRAERDVRIRNYQTLGLCAGAALAILLI